MKINNGSAAGQSVLNKIDNYNKEEDNKYNQFIVGDGTAVEALLNFYRSTNELFRNAPASSFSKTLYRLLKTAILLRPDYSTDVTREEDNTKNRKPWEGPAEVKLNADAVGELFYDIELITNFLQEMEHEADRIESLVSRYKMESLEQQIKAAD